MQGNTTKTSADVSPGMFWDLVLKEARKELECINLDVRNKHVLVIDGMLLSLARLNV